MIGKLNIKVCGMKEPDNRESLEELPVDYFGFIFYPGSPRYIGTLDETEISRLFLTAKLRVGVFVNESEALMIETGKMYNLTHFQLHGRETPSGCDRISRAGFKVIRSFSIHPEFDFRECLPFVDVSDLFLFDTKGKLHGGTGEKFNWQILENYRLEVPFFLSGGIAPGDEPAIAEFRHPMLYGLDLNSGFEDAPGIKNCDHIKEFIEKLKKRMNTLCNSVCTL